MQDVSWKVVILGAVAFLVVGVLTYASKLPSEVVSSMVGGLIGATIPRGAVSK